MKISIMRPVGPDGGDLKVSNGESVAVQVAKLVFERLTGRTTTAMPKEIVDRMGLRGISGIETEGVKLGYMVSRTRPKEVPQVVKRFEELEPEDAILFTPPIVGG